MLGVVEAVHQKISSPWQSLCILHADRVMATQAFVIRQGVEGDLGGIMSIVSEVVPMMNAVGNFQWQVGFYPLEANFVTDIQKRYCYVACEGGADGAIVGVAALTEDQDDYIQVCECAREKSIVPHRVAVRASFQGRGVARAFLLKAEQLSREAAYNVVRIDTNIENKAMQHIFKSLGYSFKGEIQLPGKVAGLRFVCYEKYLSVQT